MSKRKSDVLEDIASQPRPTRILKMASQPATTTIELTAKETQLKNLLVDTANYVNQSQSTEEPVVLRWAGGWVRDKLLGIESHDIDTAINVMTGEAFAMKICELCEKPEAIEKHSIAQDDIGSLHKIARNPEKSKHLETTTVKLLGYDVDFVNLRKETYTEDSRNPQVEFGTAEEDALRRDATVNALFYNLMTAKVEDFTTGLADMQRKLLKTPLDPLQTFTDDPLRVLRLIRFASRLKFTLDPAAEQVMGNQRVLDALRLKISRERVGVEVEKMLKGNHPRESLKYINDLGLYHTIFTDPTESNVPTPDISNWPRVYDCLEFLRINKTPGSIYDTLVRTEGRTEEEEAAYFAWVLAALAPFEDIQQLIPTKGSKSPLPLKTLAAREGIKAPHKLRQLVAASYDNRKDILFLKHAVCQKACFIGERDRFGMAIRRWDMRAGHWRLQVLSAILVDAMRSCDANPLTPNTPTAASNDAFLHDWQQFLDHLIELDVMDAPNLKRIIDGTELAKALGVKPGRWMAPALDVCAAWQFRHPGATDPAEAIEEVRRKKDELGIPTG
ncbi:hypothetical protein F4780DRAFT_770086 [Xylariomycetidae sp. FL0641]|nr:hypothetical protein F4780DRAFT_770086 [Xylariomycetidae sp. FL0641]